MTVKDFGDLTAFNSISVSGNIVVTYILEEVPSNSVTATGKQSVVKKVSASVVDSCLYIKSTHKGTEEAELVDVAIISGDFGIKRIDTAKRGQFIFAGEFDTDNISIKMDGLGYVGMSGTMSCDTLSINITEEGVLLLPNVVSAHTYIEVEKGGDAEIANLDTKSARVYINNGGYVGLKGFADEAVMHSVGKGDIMAWGFKVKDLILILKGLGVINCYATESVTVDKMESTYNSYINVSGNPKKRYIMGEEAE